jgi:hypothetical protein
MYSISHPLDWWASGGYADVVRQSGWSLPKARREVRKAIRKHGWNPIGHKGYQALRQELLRGEHLEHELN